MIKYPSYMGLIADTFFVLIPSYFDNIETLMLSCSYNISSRGMIFNYTSVSADENIKNNCPKSCSCVNYKFIYQPCGNVATGDLNT
jgi:hypothetical protein